MKSLLAYIAVFGGLYLMAGCSGSKSQRLQQLAELERQNSSREQMLNDTLAEELVSYFDRHGTANERMRAKYILGRTYYDIGELPRALETYYEAADCADTTAADCDFAKLSRIHAQSAAIFYDQVQPRSQLKELRIAEYYAKRGKDTLMAIECYALQAKPYEFLNIPDSVILSTEKASELFKSINRFDRAKQVIGNELPALVEQKDTTKTKSCLYEYEAFSNFFDSLGNIIEGLEVYYYYKGKYYLAVNKIDSAEYLFRKELRDGKDLNNQIAGCKGLQEVYTRKKISDSIAKYASLSYELNDSAYSLSEMQNIQKLQASYNYNHQKQLADQRKMETERAWFITALVILGGIIILLTFSKQYFTFRKVALDYRLRHADITRHLQRMARSNPSQIPTYAEWKALRMLVEKEIPTFYSVVNTDLEHPLNDMDYDICVAIRSQLSPIEIAKLKQCSPSTITKSRKRLLQVIFSRDGNAEDFDDEIGKIGY